MLVGSIRTVGTNAAAAAAASDCCIRAVPQLAAILHDLVMARYQARIAAGTAALLCSHMPRNTNETVRHVANTAKST